ncbi:MAG: FAD-binding oxidoreductase [Hyphomicrobiaceae bacterium]|nr:FAD-binding oxidoreductase [Hyphomicrobiaceae bacterium]
MRRKIGLLPDDDDTCGWVRLLPPRMDVRRVAGRRSFDWAVVGAGYTGLAAARRLAEHFPGQSIALVEAQRAGEGAAGRNSGFAVEISPSPIQHVVSAQATYGRSYRLNRFGQDLLRRLVEKHAIACDWREAGKYQSAAEEHHFDRLDAFARHLDELGIPHQVLDGEALAARLGTRHYRRAVHTRQTVLVQPAALTRGLALCLPKNVELLEESPVLELEAGSGVSLTCPSGTVSAGKLILATNSYLPQFGAWRNRLLSFTLTAALSRPLTEEEHQALGAPEPWGVISIHRFGATVRYTVDRRILIRNTFEYWPRMAMSRSDLLARRGIIEQSFRARFPQLGKVTFDYFWTGVICASRNITAGFGEIAKGVFAAGGCNAGGISRNTGLGTLIADYAAGAGSELLSEVVAMPIPAWMPPRPMLDIGIRLDLARRRRGLGAEL